MNEPDWKLTELDIQINGIINEFDQEEMQSKWSIIEVRQQEKKRNSKLFDAIGKEFF